MNDDQDQQSIQIRALVAFALSAAVLFLYQYFFVKKPPPVPEKTSVVVNVPEKAAPTAAPAAPSAPLPAGSAAAAGASVEQSVIVETDTYLVAFSNRGGVVTSWTLKQYKDDAGKPLELVNSVGAAEAGFPFSYVTADAARQQGLNQALFQLEADPGGGGAKVVTLRWSDGRITARKTFRFSQNSYLVDIESELRDPSGLIPHMLAWRGGFGDPAVANAGREVRTFYYDAALRKITRIEAKDAEKAPVVNGGNYLYAGLEDLYFAAIFLQVQPGQRLDLETTALQVANARQKDKQLFAGAAVGGGGDNRFHTFIGPKHLETLRAVRPETAEVVNFGFFSFIAYPLFLGLTWVHRYVHSFGWTIVIVTVIINFMLFPLKLKSMKSMKKMQKLQPLIKHINDKYKSLPLRDAKRQDQNQEVMELYNKYGVNPLGGCLPMVLQMPFFFAFYTVLRVSIEMRNASWLWVHDLSSPEQLTIRILPIAMIATQFWSQKMTPSTAADPSQQKMMQFMPLIMGFFFYGLSSGLVLYWLTGNLVGIAQQLFINRLPEPDLEIEPPKKGKFKKPRT
jgi:YidC/Oxa1 family membrane protein insertase